MLPIPKDSTPKEFDALISAARASCPTPDDVARLGLALASSGERLSWPLGSGITADVASTGGPGSLSTLIAPIALRALGNRVPKMAVPGRPAGSIDTLGTLPGYRTRLSPREVRDQMASVGFAHFQADERFAPMDADLFSYRRAVGAVDIPMLVAASLLSKKIAVGVQRVGLDVRVGPHGNFGRTATEARANARLFCASARLVGIEAVAFLTAGPTPQQPWIGRGESLLALALAVEAVDVPGDGLWLAQHVGRCCAMAVEAAGATVGPPTAGDLRKTLEEHLRTQGTDWDAFATRVGDVATAKRAAICSRRAGRMRVDLEYIRTVLVERQGGPGAEPFIDPAGVEVMVADGVELEEGAVVARVRDDGGTAAATGLADRLIQGLEVSVDPVAADSEIEGIEVIRA